MLEMGGEKKPLVKSELGCADGCGQEMGSENCADGCGRRGCQGVAGNGWGVENCGRVKSELGCADGCGQEMGSENCGRRGCNGRLSGCEMGGEKKPLVMSELGCADGCGRLRWNGTAWVQWVGGRRSRWRSASLAATAADGKWVRRIAAAGMRAWLRGRADGKWVRRMRGRLGTAWVQGSGWKWVGRRSRWRSASLAARTAADGKWMGRIARTAADGVGASKEWLEMGGEKKPLEISELGCADGCGWEMGENCADGCGRRRVRREWLVKMGWEKKPLGMSEGGCADGCGRQMDAENCADGCGRRGCNGSGWKGVGEKKPLVMSELGATEWLEMGREKNGDPRTAADGKWVRRIAGEEAAGRLRTAWVQRSGWKWVGRRSRWR